MDVEEIMRGVEQELVAWIGENVIGRRSGEQMAQTVADAFVDQLAPLSRSLRVVVHRPYSCPVDRCRWRDEVGATCPIHLRDLVEIELLPEIQLTPKFPVRRIETTVVVS